jgi:structural maintenance of chromosomes protein 5
MLFLNQIQELNKLFIEYMHELGNEGRVEIEENPASLSQWGLILSVSFRKGTAPVPLKKNVQSGGERSVSTIMFLMALQDMVKSPFRVVDEINQGMDERNERIVFKRIVERSVGPNRPQYFLITPKLLQVLLSYIYR